MKLLPFQPRQGDSSGSSEAGWWIEGPAACGACKHDWRAMVKGAEGEEFCGLLECGECHDLQGKFIDPPFPLGGTRAWCCNICDSFHFFITPEEVRCAHCNSAQRGFA